MFGQDCFAKEIANIKRQHAQLGFGAAWDTLSRPFGDYKCAPRQKVHRGLRRATCSVRGPKPHPPMREGHPFYCGETFMLSCGDGLTLCCGGELHGLLRGGEPYALLREGRELHGLLWERATRSAGGRASRFAAWGVHALLRGKSFMLCFGGRVPSSGAGDEHHALLPGRATQSAVGESVMLCCWGESWAPLWRESHTLLWGYLLWALLRGELDPLLRWEENPTLCCRGELHPLLRSNASSSAVGHVVTLCC